VLEMIAAGLLSSCHDLAEGVSRGARRELHHRCRGAQIGERLFALGTPVVQAGLLFGESQSRFLASAATTSVGAVRAIARRHDVDVRELAPPAAIGWR